MASNTRLSYEEQVLPTEFCQIIVTAQCEATMWRIDIASQNAAELWRIRLFLNTLLQMQVIMASLYGVKVSMPPRNEAELWRVSTASHYAAEFWQMSMAARIRGCVVAIHVASECAADF